MVQLLLLLLLLSCIPSETSQLLMVFLCTLVLWFHLIYADSTGALEGRNRSRCEQLTVQSAAVAAVWCYHWGQQQQDFFNISHFQGRPAPTAYITQETDVGNTQSSLPLCLPLCLPLSGSLFSHFLNCVFLLVAPKIVTEVYTHQSCTRLLP